MPAQRMKNLEKKYRDLHEIIPRLVNEKGQVRAGRILGVSSATINKWLKDNGYVRQSLYIRKNENQEGMRIE